MEKLDFGKYKGQEFEVVKEVDPKYIQWLQTQDWFKKKFGNKFNITINNFNTQDNSDTPEHNAMQIKWLNKDYCNAFFKVVYKKKNIEKEVLNINVENVKETLNEVCEVLHKISHLFLDYEKEERNKIDNVFSLMHKKITIGDNIKITQKNYDDFEKNVYKARFENRNIDVCLFCEKYNQNRHEFYYNGEIIDFVNIEGGSIKEFFIELKPNVSDDFPAILRQMKKNKCDVLFIKTYDGTGATEEEFVKYFENEKITVIFERELNV